MLGKRVGVPSSSEKLPPSMEDLTTPPSVEDLRNATSPPGTTGSITSVQESSRQSRAGAPKFGSSPEGTDAKPRMDDVRRIFNMQKRNGEGSVASTERDLSDRAASASSDSRLAAEVTKIAATMVTLRKELESQKQEHARQIESLRQELRASIESVRRALSTELATVKEINLTLEKEVMNLEGSVKATSDKVKVCEVKIAETPRPSTDSAHYPQMPQSARALGPMDHSMHDSLLEQLRRDADLIPESILTPRPSADRPLSSRGSGAPMVPKLKLPSASSSLQKPQVDASAVALGIQATSDAVARVAAMATSDAAGTSDRPLSPRQSPRQVWASELPPSPRSASISSHAGSINNTI